MGVGTVAMATGAFFATSPFGAFLTPMSRDLGWSLTTLNAAQGVGTALAGLVAPWAGRLVDRHGARVVLVLAGLGLALALFACAAIQEPWQFCLGYGLGRVVFQGVIQVVTPTAVAMWFVRRRGRATGLALMGNALGVAFSVPLIQYLADMVSWRAAWAVLGAIALGTLPPLAALLVRRRPEDLGLLPDGAAATAIAPARATAGAAEPVWRLAGAMRTRAFWLLLLSAGLAAFTLAGITTHQVPVLLHNGVPPAATAAMVSVYALCWSVGGVLWGYLGERVPVRFGLALVYLVGALGAVLLLQTTTAPGALAFAVLYGLIVAGGATLDALIWADYYGRATLGTLRGVGRPLLMVFNALGPLVAAVVVDYTGSYAPALLGFAVINVLSALLVLAARPPQLSKPPAASVA